MIDKLPALIENYVATREERLSLQRQMEAKSEAEAELKLSIEKILKEHNLTTAGGPNYRATLVDKVKPVAESWALVYKYIKANDAFDLLQKRLTESAVQLRWEDKEVIPGISKFPVTTLSITKV